MMNYNIHFHSRPVIKASILNFLETYATQSYILFVNIMSLLFLLIYNQIILVISIKISHFVTIFLLIFLHVLSVSHVLNGMHDWCVQSMHKKI